MSVRIFLAPAPRLVADIFDSSDLARLRALGELVIHEGNSLSDAEFDAQAAAAQIIADMKQGAA